MRISSSFKQTESAVTAFNLTEADLQRVCRDIAWSELSTLPHVRSRIGSRLGSVDGQTPDADSCIHSLSWAADDIDADSLTRMELATAAATWCNAYDAGFEDLFLAKRHTHDWADVMRRARAAGAAHFTFSSSGSTGERKHIRHREEILASEAMAWAQILNDQALMSVERIIVLVPTHHIYGFIWGILLPHALGKPAIEADLTTLPDLQAGDLIIAVPDQWAWLAEAAEATNKQKTWPSGVQGVSSTAPLADSIHHKLIAKDQGKPSRLSRLLQIYGSSETAGLAYRANPDSPYTLAPGRTRHRDSNGDSSIQLLLPNGEQATLAVQDELQWVSDTDFKLLRRSDHSVQIGGHNVSPDWVLAQLLKNPLIKEASLRLSTQVQPAKLKAFIVLKDENTPSMQADLEQWISDTLPHYATFSSIVYGHELPRSATGKLSDWQS
jgi:long-chain acyl-CoA synthetase